MSYDLCLQKQAQKPFYIESIRTPIYSLEELCFFLYNNICLIDDSIINERLTDWLSDELKLSHLARQLKDQLGQKTQAASFVLPIFREAGYLDSRQMREFQDQLAKLEVQSEDTRQKLRGDYLVKEKMYTRAVWEYRQILKRRNPGKLGAQFYASVWNNLGVAYARLFRFEEASACFLESYELLQTKESFRKYISTLPLFLTDEEYQERLKKIDAGPYLTGKIQEHNAKLCMEPEFTARLEEYKKRPLKEVTEELKEQYLRSTRS